MRLKVVRNPTTLEIERAKRGSTRIDEMTLEHDRAMTRSRNRQGRREPATPPPATTNFMHARYRQY
jgi:hypothetical protein